MFFHSNKSRVQISRVIDITKKKDGDRVYEKVLYINDSTGYEGELVWRY